MQEKKTLSNKVKTHTFIGLSGAILGTSAGQGIHAITFNESNVLKLRKGTVVFTQDVPNGFWNFCINYTNEYENRVYIRLTAPILIDAETGEELPPNIIISKDKSYCFKYSQLWQKTYDKNNNLMFEEYK